MSEKRFKDCFDELGEMWVLDTKTNEEYWTANSLVGLLNEQQAIIEQKNEYQRTLEAKIRRLKDRIKVLEK